MEIIEVIHQLISEFPNMHGTVLIAQGKEVLYHEGFSYRDAPFPTDKNAQHLIASVTKQFTAAALLKAFLDKNFKQNPLQEDDQTLKTAVIHDLRKPLAAFFMGTMLVMLGMQVATHQFQIGDLVVVNLYMLQLTRPLSLLGNQIRTIKNSLFELEALFTLLSQKSEITDATDAISLTSIQEIVFKDVAFAHHVDKPVFQHLNLALRKGERVAVVGSSGSGKTTLTRLLFRLYDIDRGEILINGRNIKQYRIDSLRRHISIVPQDVVLFNDTILRNIQFGNPEACLEEIEKAAQKAGIHPFILSLPEQYETMVGERGMKLSGGERQRVGIARAILKNPDLYIFDEATSSLDTKTEKEIQQNLLEISADKTALIIAHRLSTVVDCDRILVMHAGEVVEQGTHDELLKVGGLYASLWKAQSGGKKIQA